MYEQQLDKIIETFIGNFNKMCKSHRRDFLIRERIVTYESETSIKRYNVTYVVKKSRDKWSILAISHGFWIFKRKFPLFKISRFNGQINFSGLYTSSILDFKESLLKEKLEEYLDCCKKLPQNAFVCS